MLPAGSGPMREPGRRRLSTPSAASARPARIVGARTRLSPCLCSDLQPPAQVGNRRLSCRAELNGWRSPGWGAVNMNAVKTTVANVCESNPAGIAKPDVPASGPDA